MQRLIGGSKRQPRAVSPNPGLRSTRAGRSPPSVLDGIPLSGLPWPPAGLSSATFGLAPHGSAVSSRVPPTSGSPHHRHGGPGLVSVLEPTVSGRASWRRASCSEGGTSPGDPRGPSTGSGRGSCDGRTINRLLSRTAVGSTPFEPGAPSPRSGTSDTPPKARR